MNKFHKHVVCISCVALYFAVCALNRVAAADRFDGLWLSDGYGYFLEARGPKITVSEVTSLSCIDSFVLTW